MDPTSVLAGALDALSALDPVVLGDAETVVALHRELERLSAVTTRAVAAFDAGRAWGASGARTASAWLAVRCRMPVETARRRVRLGRSLRHMGGVEAAWVAGDLGEAHVRLLAAARTPAAAECFARDEEMLVEQAKTLRYGHFARCVAYWMQLADPEGTDRSAEARHAARRLHVSPTFNGWWRWRGGPWRRRRERGSPSRSSVCWWAMRPSPGGCASWPTARWWRRLTWSGGWARRGWSGWSSTAPSASATWAGAGASSPGEPAGGAATG